MQIQRRCLVRDIAPHVSEVLGKGVFGELKRFCSWSMGDFLGDSEGSTLEIQMAWSGRAAWGWILYLIENTCLREIPDGQGRSLSILLSVSFDTPGPFWSSVSFAVHFWASAETGIPERSS